MNIFFTLILEESCIKSATSSADKNSTTILAISEEIVQAMAA